jgi:uncharacterized OsmC-like protein
MEGAASVALCSIFAHQDLDAAAQEVVTILEFDVVVGAGSRRSDAENTVAFPHRWTPEGVSIEAAFTGAHLLILAAAGCVLNDVYREATAIGIEIDGVQVTATGGFDPDTWHCTGITYAVQVDSSAPTEDIALLLATVDAVAEIPRAIRSGATVTRVNLDESEERQA